MIKGQIKMLSQIEDGPLSRRQTFTLRKSKLICMWICIFKARRLGIMAKKYLNKAPPGWNDNSHPGNAHATMDVKNSPP